MGEEKAFGGAKVIYVAHVVEKASRQEEVDPGDIIPRPYSETWGDLLEYWEKQTDYNAYHARCLRVKADCTVSLGVNVIDGPEHAVQDRLAIVNDLGQSFGEVMSRVALDFETTGNGYLELVRGRAGQIEELYHCPATLVWRRPKSHPHDFRYWNNAGEVDFDLYMPGRRQEDPSVGQLVHFANPCTGSRYYGAPDWRGCLPDIEVDYYSVLYNQRFFINSGIPDMAIVVQGGEFDKETEEKVVEFLQNNIKGLDNAHRILYLPINDKEVEVKFEKLAVDMKNMDGSFEKLRATCRDNIVSAHGVPPRLVGIVTSGQLGGGGEIHGQLKVFQEITIGPRQSLFEMKLNPIIQEMGLNAKIAFEEMDTSVQEAASTYYPAMVGAKILTVDEAREEIGKSAMTPAQKKEMQEAQGGLLGTIGGGNPEDQEAAVEERKLRLVKGLEEIRKAI